MTRSNLFATNIRTLKTSQQQKNGNPMECFPPSYGGARHSFRCSAWAVPQHIDTSETAKAASKCRCALHAQLCGGPSPATLSSLHKRNKNSSHPPESEINLSKTACGCQCGRLIKCDHTRNPLILWNAFCHCTSAHTG